MYGLTSDIPSSDIGLLQNNSSWCVESLLSVCETAIAAGATFCNYEESYMVNHQKLIDLIQQTWIMKYSNFINVFNHVLRNKRNAVVQEHLVALLSYI